MLERRGVTERYDGYFEDVERTAYLVGAAMVSREAGFLPGDDPFERVGTFLLSARFVGSDEALLAAQVKELDESRRDRILGPGWENLSEEDFAVQVQQSARRSMQGARNWCATSVYRGVLGFRKYAPVDAAIFATELLGIMGVTVTDTGLSRGTPSEAKARTLAVLADHMSSSWPMWAVTNPGYISENSEGIFPEKGHLGREYSIAQFLYAISL